MKKTASTRQRGVWAGDFREATAVEQIVAVLLKTLVVGGPELGLLLASKDIRHGNWRICPPCRDGPDREGTWQSFDPE